jgi:anion-transporting  ArsA/GET3 family ATPase
VLVRGVLVLYRKKGRQEGRNSSGRIGRTMSEHQTVQNENHLLSEVSRSPLKTAPATAVADLRRREARQGKVDTPLLSSSNRVIAVKIEEALSLRRRAVRYDH